ncbi:MAG: hypothetical protein WCV79_02550 [Candidatus Paceibacterota bacterium]|jgi:hypothetical protein
MKRTFTLLALFVAATVATNAKTLISSTWVLLPNQSSPSWSSAADNVIKNALAGTLQAGSVATVVHPSQYTLPGNKVVPENFITSASTPMWKGVLNPASPFENERGQIVWALIEMRSDDGSDSVSFADLTAKFVSNDGGSLNLTLNFDNSAYTERAVLIKADGTMKKSGPASEKGKVVLVLVWSEMFTGGGTSGGIAEAKNWIQLTVSQKGDFSLILTAEDKKDPTSRSMSTVNVVRSPVAPRVSIGNNGILTINNHVAWQSYRIYEAKDVRGPWNLYSVISGGNTASIPVTGAFPAQFFRVQVQ